MKLCVVGAGIIGLSTALELQKQFSSATVTIIAEKFNQDTTSDGAAGLFLPSNHFRGPTYDISKQWMIDSYNYYKLLLENTDAGIIRVSGYILSNVSHELCENEYMKLVAPDYRPATSSELEELNRNFKYGMYLTTMVAPCRRLLPWSLQKFKNNGGTVIRSKVDSLQSLATSYDVIFNCCGLGAKSLCRDEKLVPIKGQILQVHAPSIKNFYCVDFATYIIPSGYGNIVTLGGTQDYENFDAEVDEHISQSILNRCSKFVPSVRTAPIVRTWVGHRPHRAKVRTELDMSSGSPIIHNYGHGGYGVTAGPGSAKYAVQLFQEFHNSSGNKCRL